MPAEGPTAIATLLAAVLLGAGFTAGGYLAGQGVLQARREDRVVTVKSEYQSVEKRIRAVTTVDYTLVE